MANFVLLLASLFVLLLFAPMCLFATSISCPKGKGAKHDSADWLAQCVCSAPELITCHSQSSSTLSTPSGIGSSSTITASRSTYATFSPTGSIITSSISSPTASSSLPSESSTSSSSSSLPTGSSESTETITSSTSLSGESSTSTIASGTTISSSIPTPTVATGRTPSSTGASTESSTQCSCTCSSGATESPNTSGNTGESESTTTASESSTASENTATASESSTASENTATASESSTASIIISTTSSSPFSSTSFETSTEATPLSTGSNSGTSSSSSGSSTGSSAGLTESTESSLSSTVSKYPTTSVAEHSGSTSSPEPCDCQLIQVLIWIRIYLLTVIEQGYFDICLKQIRIVLVSSFSYEVKISLCGYILRSFFAEYPSIGNKCKWVRIGDWGLLYDFAYTVAYIYEDQLTAGLIDADANGDCAFTHAVESGAANSCGSNSVGTISSFVSDCKKELRHSLPRFNKGRKMGWLNVAFKKLFFNQHPSYQNCLNEIALPKSHSVGHFLDLCNYYAVQTSLPTTVLNGIPSQCVLIQSLHQGINSSANSTNSTVIAEARQYLRELIIEFESVTDVVKRFYYVLDTFPYLSVECRLFLKRISIVNISYRAIFADILSIAGSCANGYACGDLTFGPPSASWEETCQVDTAYNLADLEDSINTYYDSLSTINKMGFSSYRNSIINCIRSSNNGNDYTARANCARYYVSGYAKQNSGLRATFLSVKVVTVIVEYSSYAVYGTLGHFCGCS